MEVQKAQSSQTELERELDVIFAHQSHMLATLDQVEHDLGGFKVLLALVPSFLPSCLASQALSEQYAR